MFTARPKRGDTDEDLLRFQEEYLASGTKSSSVKLIKKAPEKRHISAPQSVKDSPGTTGIGPGSLEANNVTPPRDVVNLGDMPGGFPHTNASHGPPIKKSKFHTSKSYTSYNRLKSAHGHHERAACDPEALLDSHDTHITKALSDIVEREVSQMPAYYPSSPATVGFPNVLHRGADSNLGRKEVGKKKSIFAQQFERRKLEDFGITIKEKNAVSNIATKPHHDTIESMDPVTTHHSAMISGEGLGESAESEANKIHQENLTLLQNMSSEEILKEQQELLNSLDPSLVAFLQHKRRVQKDIDSNTNTRLPASNQHSSGEEKVEGASERRLRADVEQDINLPLQTSKSWVHMDQSEPEKMAWMQNLPPTPKLDDKNTGTQVRFDFQGELVSSQSDIPMHMGLHHHGDEPDRAGYTLEELFQLARSANIQQRCMALQLIARILTNARTGVYVGLVNPQLFPSLLEGGVVFVMRWALDDNTDNTLAAAVKCFHSLLVCCSDEEAADTMSYWYRGYELPGLHPEKDQQSDDGGVDDDGSDKSNSSDADILKNDLVRGLLGMSFLSRLRYLLEVWEPPASVVLDILDILIRVARHSSHAAYDIMQCPRLVDTIFNQFLPTVWEPIKHSELVTKFHGYPVSKAMKLVRVLCSAGRNMASNLIQSKSLMNHIARYLAEETQDLQLRPEEAPLLQLESLRAWHVCVLYGLVPDQFEDLYPILVREVQSLSQCTVGITVGSEIIQQQRKNVVICLLEAYIHMASPKIQAMQASGSREFPFYPLSWSQVVGFIQPLQACMEFQMNNFVHCYVESKNDLSSTACVINYMTSYFSCIQNQPGYNVTEVLGKVEKLCNEILVPSLKSQAFSLALQRVRSHSYILQSHHARTEIPSNLPEFGSLVGNQADPCSLLHKESPLDFVVAISRLLLALGKLHKDMPSKMYDFILEHDDLLAYLRKVCYVGNKANTKASAFLRFENVFHHLLISLCKLHPSKNIQLYHQVALFLMSRSHAGEEHMVHDLLSTVLFSDIFLGKGPDTTLGPMDSLEINQAIHVGSVAQSTISMDCTQLLLDIREKLPSIRSTYLHMAAAHARKLKNSRSLALHFPDQIQSLVIGNFYDLLLPVDWVFLPLMDFYSKQLSLKSTQSGEESVPSEMVAKVSNVLRWLYFLESQRHSSVQELSLAMKMSRLICIFLAGSDLFLDGTVHCYLEALLKLYSKQPHLSRVDFTKPIPGLTAFSDLYTSLLVQYEAVSFGDPLFGSYILYPLQQQHPVQYRKSLWGGDHSMVLPALHVGISKLVVPLAKYLEPEENDLELLNLYFQALFSGLVLPKRSPVPYLIAVHHLNRFMYTMGGKSSKLRIAMMKQVVMCKNETLRTHLIMYKMASVECDHGIQLYSQLPESRCSFIKTVEGLVEKEKLAD